MTLRSFSKFLKFDVNAANDRSNVIELNSTAVPLFFCVWWRRHSQK